MGRDRRRVAGVERLEQRFALAVDVAFSTGQLDGPGQDWLVLVADGRQDVNNDGVIASDEVTQTGSDVYMMVASTPTQDLFVADNASFVDRITVPSVNTAIDSIYVFNGTVVEREAFELVTGAPEQSFFGVPNKFINPQVPGYATNGDPLNGYPFWDRGPVESTLAFLLPSNAIDFDSPVTGSIDLNWNPILGADVLNFTNNGGGTNFTVTGAINDPSVTFTTRLVGVVDPQVLLLVTLPYDPTTGIVGVPTMDITYDVNRFVEPGTGLGLGRNITFFVDAFGLGASVPGLPRIEVLDPTEHRYLPGTLQVDVEMVYPITNASLSAQVQEATSGVIPISFNNAPDDERNVVADFGGFVYYEYLGDGGVLTSFVDVSGEGTFDSDTGIATFSLSAGDDDVRPFSFVMNRARLAVQDIGNDNAPDPFGTVNDRSPNDFTLFPGHNLTTGLTVELANPDSRISMESPLLATAALRNVVSLAAEEININAPLRAAASFVVPDIQDSAFGTITERVTINSAVSSSSFDIRMRSVRSEAAAETLVGTLDRGLLRITQTGSLSNAADVLSSVPASPAPANNLFIEMVDGDMFLEGRVVATFQSYLIQSPEMTSQGDGDTEAGWSTTTDFPQWQPYRLTTSSRLTGVDIGSIEGDTVAITLANDTLILPEAGVSDDPYDPSRAFSELSISTNVSRLRVQASDRKGDALEWPFPYKATVRESNSLIVDAVAASSEKIDIFADGTLTLLGKLESAGDVALESTAAFTLGAPLSTQFGEISLRAPEIRVQNSVRVLDGPQDERDTDITIWATNGDLRLEDAVSGINRVVIRQEGDGEIEGNARVFADVVEVTGASDVSLRTRANRVAVRAPGAVSVEEADYGIFEIRDAEAVTLVANGYDQIVSAKQVYGDDLPVQNGRVTPADKAVVSPAIYADVYDARVLTVSAPNGSIDVYHYGSESLAVGNLDAISNGTETRMQAAGSVSIRSTLAEITVYDAPTPTGNARNVRMTTTEPLVSWSYGGDRKPGGGDDLPIPGYQNNSPGVLAGRLQKVRITRVDAAGNPMPAAGVNNNFRYGRELDGIDVTTLRLGDRILVKNGHDPDGGGNGAASLVSNGIYRILGISYPVGDTSYVELDLIRAEEADTTADLGQKHYVRVAEGGSFPWAERNGGRVFTADGSRRSTSDNGTGGDPADDFVYASYRGWGTSPQQGDYAFANVFDNDIDVVPVAVAPIPSQTGYVTATAVTQSVLTGVTFAHNAVSGDTITGKGVMPAIDGVNLLRGDRVLVRYGATRAENSPEIDELSPGLYDVMEIGAPNGNWQLKRYGGVDDDGDGGLDRFYTGRVAIDQGTDRSAATGEMFEVGLNSLGFSELRYQPVSEFTVGSPGLYDSVLNYKVDIGSNNPVAPVTYVVSTQSGINVDNPLWFGSRRATGSFGRMLTLLQGNAAMNERTGEVQEQAISFAPSVSRINLVQELPAIYRPIDISASSAVTIDGTQIERTSKGAVIRSGSVITSIGPIRATQVQSARRLYRPGQFVGERVYGLQFGETADGASVSGLSIGGFNNGAAIYVNGASNIDITNVRVGVDVSGVRLANKVGIEVTGTSVASTGVVNGVVTYGAGSAEHTTIRGSTIMNSSEAGIKLTVGSDRVHVVGNSIGATGQGNAVGILLDSTSEIPAYVGSAGILASALVQLTGTTSAVAADLIDSTPQSAADHLLNMATITVADSEFARQIRPGMVAYDSSNDIVRTITDVTWNVGGSFTLRVNNATAVGPVTGLGALYAIAGNVPVVSEPNIDFQLGHLAQSVGDGGAIANPGKITAGDRRIQLPSTISPRDVFIGQTVSSAQTGLSLGTRIESIQTSLTTSANDRSIRTETTIVTLSNPISATGTALLLFGQPAVNRLIGNADGIVVRGTASSIVNTLVTGSIYDGIRIESASENTPAVNEAVNAKVFGTHRIGDALGTIAGLAPVGVLSSQNVSIYGNQLSGIRLTDRVFAAFAKSGYVFDPVGTQNDPEDYAAIDAWLNERVRIVGNNIGFNATTSQSTGNGLTGVSNIVIQLDVGDPCDADEARIRELLLSEIGPNPGQPRARLRASTVTGLDSRQNRYGSGTGGTFPPTTDRVTVPPRRPIIRN